jgi:hypothetical protein
MQTARLLLAILALGALTMDVGLAKSHGHSAHKGTGGPHSAKSNTNAPPTTNTPTETSTNPSTNAPASITTTTTPKPPTNNAATNNGATQKGPAPSLSGPETGHNVTSEPPGKKSHIGPNPPPINAAPPMLHSTTPFQPNGTKGNVGKGAAESPVDVRITVQPRRTPKRSVFGDEPKKPATTLGIPGKVESRRPPTPSTNVTRNALGIAVEPQTARGTTQTAPTVPAATNAGAAKLTTPLATTNAAPATGNTKINANAGIVHSQPAAPTPPVAAGGSHITGTGLVRPGSGPGAIGGAAKNVASINGTTVRARH